MSVISEEDALCSEDSDEEHLGDKCVALFSSLLNATQSVTSSDGGSLPPPLSPLLIQETLLADAKTDPHETVVLEEQLLDEMASSSHSAVSVVRQRPQVPPKPPIDTVRYSMNNLKESVLVQFVTPFGDPAPRPSAPRTPSAHRMIAYNAYLRHKESSDWQLDALLEELSALETQLNSSSSDLLLIPSLTPQKRPEKPETAPRSTPLPQRREEPPPPRREEPPQVVPPPPPSAPQRTLPSASSCSSPDGDSAFCDGSSTESRNRNSAFSSSDSCRESLHTPSPTQVSPRNGVEQTPDERKAQKIKEALEKMKEAKVTRIFVKFFVEDGDPLQMLVDERWTVGETMRQLADKHHITLTEDHCIVEEFPELYIRRIYEDHENLVENIQMWQQDSQNKLHFIRRSDKYPFLDRPELYLVTEKTTDLEVPKGDAWTREVKQKFVEDFFSRETVSPPELEGFLYLKSDGRKSWKKHYFVLRPSGLYYAPKGKKTTSKDLQCLMNLHSNQVYAGINWHKKYKAPTEYCISIKLTQLQIKRSQYIKYICAEDEPTFRKWIVALRIAKNGAALYENYVKACDTRRATSLSRATSSLLQEPQCSTSASSSQHDLRIQNKMPQCSSPSQLSRHSQMTTLSAAQSTDLQYDEQPTGTIKRAPVDVVRRISQSGSSRSPSLGGEEDDSDEDFPAPPPVYASRTTTPSALPPRPEPRPLPAAPPPKPAFHSPVVVPPSLQTQHMIQPTPRKQPPPPPPKRSEATRVQSITSPGPNMNDLEAALARRREKMAQQV